MPPQVLVVEDNRMLRTLFASGLTGFGYGVTEAGSLEQARQVLNETRKPDMILLDLQLPDGSGETLIQFVREELGLPEIRIVVATGIPIDEQHLLGIGANAVLQKPIEFNALYAALAGTS
ncbi:MAG: response regulator [Anaerolineae bacterium]|nr:response regulator [Anaerolineae bacterium]